MPSLAAAHEMHDDLTVRVSLELCGGFEGFAEGEVVVDFTVNGEDEGLVVVDEGLSSGV